MSVCRLADAFFKRKWFRILHQTVMIIEEFLPKNSKRLIGFYCIILNENNLIYQTFGEGIQYEE